MQKPKPLFEIGDQVWHKGLVARVVSIAGENRVYVYGVQVEECVPIETYTVSEGEIKLYKKGSQ